MFLKNINTGKIGEFVNHQGNDWIELTKTELTKFKFEKCKQKAIDLRQKYLDQSFRNAVEFLLENSDYPEKEKRESVKREIKNIKEVTTAKSLEAIEK